MHVLSIGESGSLWDTVHLRTALFFVLDFKLALAEADQCCQIGDFGTPRRIFWEQIVCGEMFEDYQHFWGIFISILRKAYF